jgi:hypothetical protein
MLSTYIPQCYIAGVVVSLTIDLVHILFYLNILLKFQFLMSDK